MRPASFETETHNRRVGVVVFFCVSAVLFQFVFCGVQNKCCGDLDSQQDGIASIRRRPREAAIGFTLEAYIVTVSTLLSGDSEAAHSGAFNHRQPSLSFLQAAAQCMKMSLVSP